MLPLALIVALNFPRAVPEKVLPSYLSFQTSQRVPDRTASPWFQGPSKGHKLEPQPKQFRSNLGQGFHTDHGTTLLPFCHGMVKSKDLDAGPNSVAYELCDLGQSA